MARKFLAFFCISGILSLVALNAGSLVANNPELHSDVLQTGISIGAKAIIGTISASAYLWQARDLNTPLTTKVTRAIGVGSLNAGYFGMLFDQTLIGTPSNPENFQHMLDAVLFINGVATIALTQKESHDSDPKIMLPK